MEKKTQREEPLLQIRGITKQFTGTLALDHVDIDIFSGEVHALLGENGAGKSTLIKILSSIYDCNEGELVYKGKNIGLDVKELSLSVIHQDLGLVDDMTVAENIAMITGYPKTRLGMIDWKKTNRLAIELLSRMDCRINPQSKVQLLSAAEKSMVAISRALAKKTDILILDEPTATLPQGDVEKLFKVIRTLSAEGIAIIYVTHRLDEVFQIANRVTVMRNGRLITSDCIENTSPDKLVLDIVGKEVATVSISKDAQLSEDCLLEMKNVLTSFAGPVSFKLHRGEILAFFGLRGAGHHEVGRCLWGLEKLDEGEMFLNGKKVKISSPEAAIHNGIGFVSSKRREEGIAASFTVQENIYINPAINSGVLRPMDLKEERKKCADVIKRFSIKPNDGERTIGTLSGGNQQKAVVARWFEADCDLLIFEEPTIGVDVGAKADIYNMMLEALKNGKAIILISSDHEEVLRLSHRAIVFSKGRIVGEIDRSELSGQMLSSLASGARAN